MLRFRLFLIIAILPFLAACATKGDCWKPDFSSQPWKKFDEGFEKSHPPDCSEAVGDCLTIEELLFLKDALEDSKGN